MDKEKHDKIAKEYAEKRKQLADIYYKLFASASFGLLLFIMDFFTGFTPMTVKGVFLFILSILAFVFYKKWRYLSTKRIVTAELPTGQILVGSEKIRFRIGGDRLVDKIRRFFEEM